MRTTRLLTVSRSIPCILGGGSAQPPTNADQVGSAQPLLDADPRRCRPFKGRSPWMQIPSHVTCDASWEANHPPTEWHTGVKTLPCPKTSFAGGNNRLASPFPAIAIRSRKFWICHQDLIKISGGCTRERILSIDKIYIKFAGIFGNLQGCPQAGEFWIRPVNENENTVLPNLVQWLLKFGC